MNTQYAAYGCFRTKCTAAKMKECKYKEGITHKNDEIFTTWRTDRY
jgi:hypothetical protein